MTPIAERSGAAARRINDLIRYLYCLEGGVRCPEAAKRAGWLGVPGWGEAVWRGGVVVHRNSIPDVRQGLCLTLVKRGTAALQSIKKPTKNGQIHLKTQLSAYKKAKKAPLPGKNACSDPPPPPKSHLRLLSNP